MSKSQGRGRDDAVKFTKLEAAPSRMAGEGASGFGEGAQVGRGGYRAAAEMNTIPAEVTNVVAGPQQGHKPIDIMTNFIRITPMKERQVYQYRVDFVPNVEAVSLRCRMFKDSTKEMFPVRVVFDGGSDARSSHKTPKEETTITCKHPAEPDLNVNIVIKLVGQVTWGSFEMLRLYNMQMKSFLKLLGFFPVGKTGTYVHPELETAVGQSNLLVTIRGYKTAANVHHNNQILMNLESTHKLMQRKSVLQNFMDIKNDVERDRKRSLPAALKEEMQGKLVVTNYNKVTYRVEDVNLNMNPTTTFRDEKNNKNISYVEYYQTRYNKTIRDLKQPLLLVTPNSVRARQVADDEAPRDIYLVPELCNIAGLTNAQRNNNQIKTELIRSSQIPPGDRVNHLLTFLGKLNQQAEVQKSLQQWGYTYDKEPLKIQGRLLPNEGVAMASSVGKNPTEWPKVDQSAGFDNLVMRDKVAKAASFDTLGIVVGFGCQRDKIDILDKLKRAFTGIGCEIKNRPHVVDTASERSHDYANALRNMPNDLTATIIIMPSQHKGTYQAIKKLASVERGMITQVVTARLLTDERKARGAATKIAIQVAAKIGGEPWYVHLPLRDAMACGYDTYHNSAPDGRSRSYGAFVASMNDNYSQWWSKVDGHEALDELSTNMAQNLTAGLENYKRLNGKYPDRVVLYRDGVGDGQLEHVYNIELAQVREAIAKVESARKIMLTFIVVNKRIGARFYMRQGNGFTNPPPGSVIDSVVTRDKRYDFYLVSQSTRHGTVTPTYYNILADDSKLDANKHQMMAYKLCFMYYNWTGTVRVPAPCQYAHKLALLCGEYLHGIPNALLDNRLHFL